MGNKTLKGGTDGTANLSTAGHFEEGAALADGDTLILPAISVRVTGGLDCSAYSTGINVVCQPGCAVELGGSAGTFLCKILSLIAAGSGAKFTISGAVTKAFVSQGASVTAAGGIWAASMCDGGSLRFSDAASITDLVIAGSGGVFADTHASDRINNLFMAGGSLSTRRSVQIARMGGPCSVEMLDAATCTDGSGSGQFDLLHPLARVMMKLRAAATFDRLNCYAGKFQTEGMVGALTITNALRTAQSEIQNTYSGGAIVYTNTPTDYGYKTFAGGGGGV